MTAQNKDARNLADDAGFTRRAVSEQKSYTGWAIGAVALVLIALAAILIFPHQTLEQGSINGNQSKDGSPPASNGLGNVGSAPADGPANRK
jgi:hypothetical protein